MPVMNARQELGNVPHEEPCAQTGIDSPNLCRAQAQTFSRQLQRMFPIPTDIHAAFKVAASQHEFGTYYEVVLDYDATNPAAQAFVGNVEESLPSHWDQGAKASNSLAETIQQAEQARERGEISADTLWDLKYDAMARQDDVVLANWVSARLASLRRMSAEPGYTPPAIFAVRWKEAQALIGNSESLDLTQAAALAV